MRGDTPGSPKAAFDTFEEARRYAAERDEVVEQALREQYQRANPGADIQWRMDKDPVAEWSLTEFVDHVERSGRGTEGLSGQLRRLDEVRIELFYIAHFDGPAARSGRSGSGLVAQHAAAQQSPQRSWCR